MKRLWIADLHANLPAFEAVLNAAGSVEAVVFLGDVVGYGPHPSACVALLQHTGAHAILGNHDQAILACPDDHPSREGWFNWDQWTREQLTPAHLAYLHNLPLELTIPAGEQCITVMHRLPGSSYLHPAMPEEMLADAMQGISEPFVACGHSHRAIERDVRGRRLLCLPAVGQPRNGDPRAGYAIECDGVFDFHYVDYNVELTVHDTQQLGLDNAFCQRWIAFLRTGFDAEWSREYLPVQTHHEKES